MGCGKEAKIHKYFIQKVVDISEIEGNIEVAFE